MKRQVGGVRMGKGTGVLFFVLLLRDRSPSMSPLRKRSRHAVARASAPVGQAEQVKALGTRLLKRALLVMAGLVVLMGVGLAGWAYKHQDELLAHRAVEHVVVRAPLQHITAAQLEALVMPYMDAGFFGADLSALRDTLEQQPWVRRAVVTRSWPATVRIQIKERTPIAYWGDDKMLDQQGVLFQPQRLPEIEGLPILKAPSQYADWVMQQYHQMNGLLRSVDVHITELQLNSHMSWRLLLNNGVTVKVDRHSTADKLVQLVMALPKLMAMERPVDQIDLRYLKGFAVKWRALNASDDLISRS